MAVAAFADCVGLTHIEIPRGVRSISYAAFRDCTSLTSVTFPNGVSTLSARVLTGCVNLSRVILPDTIKEIQHSAFAGCSSLGTVSFEGDAPLAEMSVFDTASTATIQFRQGTSGWGSEFAGRPTLLWSPEIRTSDSSFGVQNGRFGFTIAGPGGTSVVVESCMELLFPAWKPVATNILSNGSVYFQDPESGDQSSRFYRLRSP